MNTEKNIGDHYCTNCGYVYTNEIPYTCDNCGHGNFKPDKLFGISSSNTDELSTDLYCKELLNKLQTEPLAFVSIIISKHLNDDQKASLKRWLTSEVIAVRDKQPQTVYVDVPNEPFESGEFYLISSKSAVKNYGVRSVNKYFRRVVKQENVYLNTPAELEARDAKLKAEWQREQWISVKRRLPTEHDTCEDYFNKVWTLQVGRTYPTEMTYWEVKSCPFTKYWMPIPPKPFPFLPEPAKD